MTPMSTVISACALILVTVAGTQAQDSPPSRNDDAPSVLAISEKSAVAAGVLEWVFPTLGYGYAGDWSRGLPSALVRIAGIFLIIDHQFVIFGEPPPCQGQCILGTVMAVGGSIWAIVDAGRTANRENERRRAAVLGATVVPTYSPSGAGISVHVPVGW
jgi:hypothetical protein